MRLLEDFETGRLDPAEFSHRAHVEAAFELLSRTDFLDAARRYQRGIEALARAAGAPQKANLTITLAFLSLIAERRAQTPDVSFEEFAAANPDLLRRDVLKRFYRPERLGAPLARRAFLMPDLGPPIADHAPWG